MIITLTLGNSDEYFCSAHLDIKVNMLFVEITIPYHRKALTREALNLLMIDSMRFCHSNIRCIRKWRLFLLCAVGRNRDKPSLHAHQVLFVSFPLLLGSSHANRFCLHLLVKIAFSVCYRDHSRCQVSQIQIL